MPSTKILTKENNQTTELIAKYSEPATSGSFDRLSVQVSDGERVRAEFEELWNIYSGRRDGISMSYVNGAETVVDDVIATRYFDERAVEETYWRTRSYELGVKGGVREQILVRVATDIGENEMLIDEDGQVKVLKRQSSESNWELADADESRQCMDDFFYRTTIAADVHNRRSPEEKLIANDHARALLRERYPILAAPRAYEE